MSVQARPAPMLFTDDDKPAGRPRAARLPARHHPTALQRQAFELLGFCHRLGVT